MHTSFLTFGIIMLLGAMLPGADFAIVTKNSLLHSRKAGIYTALGISAGMCVHMIYCVLGLAVVIRESTWLFHGIQYAGALYLSYLGIMLLKPHSTPQIDNQTGKSQSKSLSLGKAFQQGLICNLLNPKATLLFLTLFSAVSSSHSSFWINLVFAFEAVATALLWFCSLAYMISHKSIVNWLNRSQKTIERILGLILLSLAVSVVFLSGTS